MATPKAKTETAPTVAAFDLDALSADLDTATAAQVSNLAKEPADKDAENVRILSAHIIKTNTDRVGAFIQSALSEQATDLSLLGLSADDLHGVLSAAGSFSPSNDRDVLARQFKQTRGAIRTLQSNTILNRRPFVLSRTRAKGRGATTTYFTVSLDGLPEKAVEYLKAVFSRMENAAIPADGILKGEVWDKLTRSAFARQTDNTAPSARK